MTDLFRLIALQWRHHRLAFAGGVLLAVVPAIAGVALLGTAGWYVTAAAIAGVGGLLVYGFGPGSVIRVLAFWRTFGRYAERIATHDATFRFLTNLRARIFQGQADRAGNGRERRSGIALNRLTSDITALDAVYLRLVVPIVVAGAVGLVAIHWTVQQSAYLALGPGALLLFLAILVIRSLVMGNGRSARRQEAALDAVRLRTVDLVAGRRDLAVYGGLDSEADTVRSAHERLARAEQDTDLAASALAAWTGFAAQASIVLTMALAFWLTRSGAITAPVAVASVLVAVALPEILGAVVPGLAGLGRTRLAARRAIAGTKPLPAPGATRAVALSQAETGRAAPLAFHEVSFGYPSAGRQVLESLSFSVADGEWLAVVGRSGCGKSTVSALAAGLLQADTGAIHLNGKPLSAYSEDELRSMITVIGQRPFLFNDTLAANLRIAAPDASDEQLWQALDIAALSERVRQNPMGLEAMLGEGGIGLSGGEQRRLGLARAYLTRPMLFILDEFTEGLDDETAGAVLDGFKRFRGGVPVLMIAHKPAEIAAADRLLRLEVEGGLTPDTTRRT
ncbi:amino acid ABC transporter ATP-binding/permease protein [Roseibium sp.]|uniref:amino acid ABC transporter ATP-binding/permease protein n=1 Tax=Roseibium sp. TaxID=1936156 RepID=UPI003A97DD44